MRLKHPRPRREQRSNDDKLLQRCWTEGTDGARVSDGISKAWDPAISRGWSEVFFWCARVFCNLILVRLDSWLNLLHLPNCCEMQSHTLNRDVSLLENPFSELQRWYFDIFGFWSWHHVADWPLIGCNWHVTPWRVILFFLFGGVVSGQPKRWIHLPEHVLMTWHTMKELKMSLNRRWYHGIVYADLP